MSHLDDLNAQYPVRRTKEEKTAFRAYITKYLTEKGVSVQTETTKNGKNENVVVGNPLIAEVVCTAHYDTPGQSLFPNIMIPRNIPLFFAYQMVPVLVLLALSFIGAFVVGFPLMLLIDKVDKRIFFFLFMFFYYVIFYLMFFAFKNKKNHNDNTSGVATLLEIIDRLSPAELEKVAFIFFDNEEKGKKGAKAYNSDHKEQMKNRLVLNFDCVGNGEHILFIAKKDAENLPIYQALQTVLTSNETYQTAYYPMKGSEANSDYKEFPCGVGCMACKKTKGGLLYAPYIHTSKDIVANNENIIFIAEGVKKWISSAI